MPAIRRECLKQGCFAAGALAAALWSVITMKESRGRNGDQRFPNTPVTPKGQDRAAAVTTSLTMAAGAEEEAVLGIPRLEQPRRNRTREFLVALDSADGATLSSNTTCRLWVLDDDLLLSPGTVQFERYPGTADPSLLLLVLGTNPWPDQHLEISAAVNTGWSRAETVYGGRNGVRVRPTWMGGEGQSFYRLRE